VEIAKIGLGKTSGLGHYSDRAIDWRTADLRTVLEWSPQIALARHWKIPFAPFVQSITACFLNPVDTIGPFALGNNNGGSSDALSVVSVVDQVVIHVDAPNYNSGNAMKGFLDWFWARQTGVQATLFVDGAPRFNIAPDFTPIDTLAAMMTEMWPSGWVLNFTQVPKMQFKTSFALPSNPTTFYVTFRMWQPVEISRLVAMTDSRALRILVDECVITKEEAECFCVY
jgi:hypothetical protein